jgi:acetyl coenzyme A synthetase (ADP forming)-like protein
VSRPGESEAGPRRYAADALLKDGGSVHIRAIRPEDKQLLREHFRGLSAESVRFRFLGAKKDLSESELRYLTEIDFVRHVALVATHWTGDVEQIVGVARYVQAPEAPRAEMAIVVADGHQHRGLGTALLEHLAQLALRAGVREFEADVSSENRAVLDMLRKAGFSVTGETDVLHFTLTSAETEGFLEAGLQRFRSAAAESVRRLLHPRSVAVVGASRKPGTIGATLIANLRRYGFTGALHPVNPSAVKVAGLRAFNRVTDIPHPVDLVVIAAPAASVEGIVADCARAGAHGVVIISAGFAEASEEGRLLQERIRREVREAGMRLIGPNCMGILNTDPEVRLDATFAPVAPLAGNVAFLSQSGALGVAVLDHARSLGIGISSFVSVGNKADVSGNDLLAYWRDDPRTDVVALYLESFGNPARFAALAPEVARAKPIVAVKSGRSAAGSRAASSHSAALACLDVGVDALFEQAGVIRTETLEGLFDVVALLATQPVPPGPRVGVVTNAGGPGILLADACETHGLRLPELEPATMAKLREFLPSQAGVRNPVDMIASAGPEDFTRAMACVGGDRNVDSVVAIYVPPLTTRSDEVALAIARGAGEVPSDKPVLTVFLSSKGAPEGLSSGPRGQLPSFSFPENAARALAAAEGYARWRRRPQGRRLRLSGEAREAVRRLVDRALDGRETPRWLDPDEVERILRAVGIPLVESRPAAAEDAAAVARTMDGPLVLKAVASGLVHKSDVGGVMLGLESPEEVAEGVDELRSRLSAHGHRMESVLLQREVRGGIEALVGVVEDPTFGPLVVCGLGGVQVELLRDASFRLPPVTDVDARDMIDRLRGKALFDGYRGAPPADREALVSILQRVSALAEAAPELCELDLNPVKVLAPGAGAVVLDARIRLRGGTAATSGSARPVPETALAIAID